MDEVLNLNCDRGLGCLCQSHHFGNQTHECVVTYCNHESTALAWLDQSALEHDVLSFQWFVLDVVSETFQFETFSSKARVVHIEIGAFNDSQVSWNAHTLLKHADVTNYDISWQDFDLSAITHYCCFRGYLIFEGCHCIIGLELLLESKYTCEEDYGAQDNS